MLAGTINFEGATKDGAQHINQQLASANGYPDLQVEPQSPRQRFVVYDWLSVC